MKTWISKPLEKLISLERWQKKAVQILADGLLAPSALILAIFLVSDLRSSEILSGLLLMVIVAVSSSVMVFAIAGLYNVTLRFHSTEITIATAVGSLISTAALFVADTLFDTNYAAEIFINFTLIHFLIVTAMRLGLRASVATLQRADATKVVIYGSDQSAIQLMQALSSDYSHKVFLFIDENKILSGQKIYGIPVKTLDEATPFLKRHEIRYAFISKNSLIPEKKRDLLNHFAQIPVSVKLVPDLISEISSSGILEKLEEIDVEDLLGREPAKPNYRLLRNDIQRKSILVTGAGGSIGSELCRQIIAYEPRELILLDVSEAAIYQIEQELKSFAHGNQTKTKIIPIVASVTDIALTRQVFKQSKIDTVYHAAAYKHVNLMQTNEFSCLANNFLGTWNVAHLAGLEKVPNFLLVSTDKAVHPTNMMGVSKQLAEATCIHFNKMFNDSCYTIVRFGNVLGSSGSVVPLFKKQIKAGGPITVTSKDATRYFMSIPEAASLVLQANAMARGGEVFILDMGEPIKIYDLAIKMAQLAGYQPSETGSQDSKNGIELKIIGLKPGEKAHEALTTSKNLQPTDIKKIFMTQECDKKEINIKLQFKDFEKAIATGDLTAFKKSLIKKFPNLCE